jgi:hypothetical protein
MTNCLRGGSLTFDPLFLETFAKHYFSDGFKAPMPLRGDALLNDKAFNFVKVLLVVRLVSLKRCLSFPGCGYNLCSLSALTPLDAASKCSASASRSQAHGRRIAILLKRAHPISAVRPCRPPRHPHHLLR